MTGGMRRTLPTGRPIGDLRPAAPAAVGYLAVILCDHVDAVPQVAQLSRTKRRVQWAYTDLGVEPHGEGITWHHSTSRMGLNATPEMFDHNTCRRRDAGASGADPSGILGEMQAVALRSAISLPSWL